MKDFLGVNLQIGDYVAAGGAGNGKAEYGMILHQVTAISPKLKLRRLDVSYKVSKPAIVTSRTITSKNSNKYVRIDPPANIVDLFTRAVAGKITDSEANVIGDWLHGADHQVPPS